MKGKYLYAISRKQDLNPTLNKDGLSTVDLDSLSCVITDAEFKDYQSLAKKEVIKELTSHQEMIEKIMENFGSVLPVKFGTMLKNDKEVKSVLEKGYSFLRDTLKQTEDKIELDLVCFWNEEKAAQIAFKEDKRVQKMQKNLIKKTKISPQDKIALGKQVANYLAGKRKKISSQILRVLEKRIVKSCSHVLADVNMLLNQAFLVKRENEEGFNHALNKLDSKFAGLVNFRLVGPLPPYSFTTVVVEALEKKEVEKAKELLGLNGSTESTLSKVEGFTTGGELKKEKIKKVYGKLAFKFHPDHGGDPTKFERVTKSYKLLRKYADQGLMVVYLYRWKHENPDLCPDYSY